MLSQSGCPSAEDLRRALQGELPGQDGESIAAHLETCVACAQLAATVEVVEQGSDELRNAAQLSAAAAVSAVLAKRLKALWNAGDPATYRARAATPVPFAPPLSPNDLGHLGHYRVLRQLGAGGMGEVFAAQDTQLNRPVAIKVLSSTDSVFAEMMLRERTLLAALRHRNIVSVYDSGELGDGRPYLIMEFVEGETLDAYVAAHPPKPNRLVELIRDVAAAVGASHALGIVHRDLKPENIMVTPAGEARVLDFGLAKRVSASSLIASAPGEVAEGTTGKTGIVGTRGFMSPEQSRGFEVDARTDVFALGTILDRLLPPDRHPDLAAVIAKGTSELPEQRYADATALATDLDHWLAQRPVSARRPPVLERVLQWSRRQPAVAALLAVSIMALVSLPIAVISGVYNARLTNSLADTQRERKHAEDAERRVREAAYYNRILLAGQEWREAQIGRAKELLAECDEAYRGWEWQYLSRVCNPRTSQLVHPDAVDAVAVSPDGLLIASGSQDHGARIWVAQTGVLRHHLQGHTDRIYRLSFDPAGARLATASSDGSVRIWDTARGHELFKFTGHQGQVRSALFSLDGKWVASAAKDGRVKVWDPQTGEVRLDLEGVINGHDHPLAFGGPENQWLAYASHGPMQIWDIKTGKTGKLAFTIPGPEKLTLRGLAFDPAGVRLAAVGGDENIVVWAVPPQPNAKPKEFRGESIAYGVAWSTDGNVLATAGMDGAIYLWNPSSGTLLKQILGHEGRIYGLAFSPDGHTLVSASTDRTVRMWDTQTLAGYRRLDVGSMVRTLCWHPDGDRLFVGYFPTAATASIVCFDLSSGQRRFEAPLNDEAKPVACAVSPNGKLLAVGGAEMPVTLLDAETGEILFSLAGHSGVVQVVLFSADSRFLASADRTRQLRIWDLVERREVSQDAASDRPDQAWLIGNRSIEQVMRAVPAEAQVNHGVAWSPDARHVASWGDKSHVTVWDMNTGKVTAALRGHTHGMNSLSWSSDGRRLATASTDRTVRIWDPLAGQQTLVLRGFLQGVNTVAWSPDGRRLAAGSGEGTVLIWDGSPWNR